MNRAARRLSTAEKIAELKPHAKTIVIGLEVAESTKEISDCFIQEAKKAGLDIINETNNEADNASGSQKVFEPLLTKYPEVEAVFNYNDESAMGVSAALLAAGKTIATVEEPRRGHRHRFQRRPGRDRSGRRRPPVLDLGSGQPRQRLLRRETGERSA